MKRFPSHIVPTDDDDILICTRIRAIQGHSTRVNSELLHRKLLCEDDDDFPTLLGHATNFSSMESILETGLQPGGLDRKRDENHFLPIRPEQDSGSQRWLGSRASMPGMRVGTDIIIYFSTRGIMNQGIVLRQSAGGAVLTKHHVPANTIISIRARENGAVKNVNINMVEQCSDAERVIVIETTTRAYSKTAEICIERIAGRLRQHGPKKKKRPATSASLRLRNVHARKSTSTKTTTSTRYLPIATTLIGSTLAGPTTKATKRHRVPNRMPKLLARILREIKNMLPKLLG